MAGGTGLSNKSASIDCIIAKRARIDYGFVAKR